MSTARPLPLTPARRWALAAGVPAVVLLMLAVAGSLWTRAAVKFLAGHDQRGYRVSFQVPAGPRIRVTDGLGDLTLRTAAVPDIRVTGRLRGSFTPPTLGRRATPAGLALAPGCPVSFGTCSASLAVTAPAERPVSASTSFGTLRATGLRGQITLAADTGDLAVSRLSGAIQLNDSFGTLTATGLSGSIGLYNNTGDISASAVRGDTTIRDSFGNINVTGLSAADVTVGNDTGDVMLRFATVPDHVVVTDSFANVTLVLPAGASYRVSARTSFGNRTVRVPQASSSRHVITVSDSNGDVTIVTAGSGG